MRGVRRPIVRSLSSGERMVEKAFLVEPSERRFHSFVIQAIMVVIGVGAFLLFIGKTLGTAQELSTGTIDPSDPASMERTGLAGIRDPAAPTQNGQVTAGP